MATRSKPPARDAWEDCGFRTEEEIAELIATPPPPPPKTRAQRVADRLRPVLAPAARLLKLLGERHSS